MPRSLELSPDDIVDRAVRPSSAAAPSRDPIALAERPGSSARARFAPGPDGDEAFRAHLEALSERLLAAERNRTPKPRALYRKVVRVVRGELRRDGAPLNWLDLRTLSCAGCGRDLLGPSDEPVRAGTRERAVHGCAASRQSARQSLPFLPPPVAGRVHDRPVCARCLPAAVPTGARA